jgi:hypothetical protein
VRTTLSIIVAVLPVACGDEVAPADVRDAGPRPDASELDSSMPSDTGTETDTSVPIDTSMPLPDASMDSSAASACEGEPCFVDVACTEDSTATGGFRCDPCPTGYAGDGVVCTPGTSGTATVRSGAFFNKAYAVALTGTDLFVAAVRGETSIVHFRPVVIDTTTMTVDLEETAGPRVPSTGPRDTAENAGTFYTLYVDDGGRDLVDVRSRATGFSGTTFSAGGFDEVRRLAIDDDRAYVIGRSGSFNVTSARAHGTTAFSWVDRWSTASDRYRDVAATPSTIIAVGRDWSVRNLDPATGAEMRTRVFASVGAADRIVVVGDAMWLAGSSVDSTTSERVWRLESRTLSDASLLSGWSYPWPPALAATSEVVAFEIEDDSAFVGFGLRRPPSISYDDHFALVEVDLPSGRVLWTLTPAAGARTTLVDVAVDTDFIYVLAELDGGSRSWWRVTKHPRRPSP